MRRPPTLSEWCLFGQNKTFCALGGTAPAYMDKIRKTDRPVICITDLGRGKWRWLLELDVVEGFRSNNMTTTCEGQKAIKPWFSSKVYRSPRHFYCLGPNYYSARFNSLDYVVEAANALANLPASCYQPYVPGRGVQG